MARVYVSSTFRDLEECRQKVRDVLRRMGHEDVAMEYYVAEDKRPIERCLQDVEACDLFLGIYAWRYGYVPEGGAQSVTEMEYCKAVALGKERLLFLLEEGASWPMDRVEMKAYDKIKALRDEICRDRMVSMFANADLLQARVTEAVSRWDKEHGRTQTAADWDPYRQAVYAKHGLVPLAVIAGAAKETNILAIPLREVFVPQWAERGTPRWEVSDEVLEYRRELYQRPEPSTEEAEVSTEEESGEATAPAAEKEIVSSTLSAVEVVGRERLQVILGGPGSGKSTLLHYVMLQLCAPEPDTESLPPHLRPNKPGDMPIPFLVELRRYTLTPSSDFVSYIAARGKDVYGVEIDAQSVNEVLEQEGQALVLFDGLDEVFDARERAGVIEQFTAFARQFPHARLVVTSRIAGYDRYALGTAGFEHYTLIEFNTQQIREFAPRWYRYFTLEGTERDAEGLVQCIIESPRLLDLAGNPLLLTMMAVIYKYQELPERRWKLYEVCSEVLLEQWDLKQHLLRIEEGPLGGLIRGPQKAAILQRVSMYMLEHGQPGRELNAIAHPPVVATLAGYLQEQYGKTPGEAGAIAEGVLSHLRERTYILAAIGEGIYGFVHRTFMEYFAACELRDRFNERKADYAWLTCEIYGPLWQEERWREVLLLLVGMLADQRFPVGDVVDYLFHLPGEGMPYHIAFAARCLAEAGRIEDAKQAQEIVGALVAAILAQHARSHLEEAVAFADEGVRAVALVGPRVEVPASTRAQAAALGDADSFADRVLAFRLGLALMPEGEALAKALGALQSDDLVLRMQAIIALEKNWPGRGEVGKALLAVVQGGRDLRTRRLALETLTRTWPRSAEVLVAVEAWLRDPATDATYRRWLVQHLVREWWGHAGAQVLVAQLTAGDDERLRRVAQEVLGEERKVSEAIGKLGNTLGDEQNSATVAGQGPEARRTTVEVLGQSGDPRAVEALKTTLLDEDRRVRQAAVEALDRIGWVADRSEAGAIYWIAKRRWGQCVELGEVAVGPLVAALRDDTVGARREVVDALGKTGAVEAVAPLIEVLADRDDDVRRGAARALEKIGKRAVERLSGALRDGDSGMRRAVAETLGNIGDARAVEALSAVLGDVSANVRRGVVAALRQIGDARAVEPLRMALLDEDAAVRAAVLGALDALGWQPDRSTQGAAYWVTKRAWERCLELGELAVEPLIEALGNQDPDVRRAAVAALGQIRDTRAVEPLRTTLGDEDAGVRAATVEALDALGWRPDHSISGATYWVTKHAWDHCLEFGRLAVEPLIETLRDQDRDVRGGAVAVLGQIGDARAVEPLSGVLRNGDSVMRRGAAEALGQIGDARAVESLIAALSDHDPDVRREATVALGQIGDARGVEPLIAGLRDRGRDMRVTAARALARIGTPAVDSLTGVLRDGDAEMRRAAVGAMEQIGAPAVDPLIGALRQADSDVRRAAAAALGRIGTPAVEPLIAALGKGSSFVRRAAAEALGLIGDVRAVVCLVAALGDGDEEVRRAAAGALDVLGWQPDRSTQGATYWAARRAWERCVQIGEPAVEPLIGALRDMESGVRREAAAGALGQIGDLRAVQPLSGALRDGDADVRRTAAAALGQIGDARAVEPLIRALGDEDTHVRREVVMALAKLGDVRAVGPLTGALSDPDPDVRPAAAGTLVRIGPPAVDALIGALGDEHRPTRYHAAWALGQIADVRAVEPLSAALRDDDTRVRREVVAALAEIGGSRVAKPLIVALGDRDDDVRRGAARALEELGGPAVEPLIEALRNQDPDVRREAVAVLGRTGDARAVEALRTALGDEDAAVRTATVGALDTLGWQPDRSISGATYWVTKHSWDRCLEFGGLAVEPLLGALKDGDYDVRRAATVVLGEIGDARAVEPLIAMLGGWDSGVRRAAAEALRKIGDARGVAEVLRRGL